MGKFCIMCGSKIEEGDKYCVNCGFDQQSDPKKVNNTNKGKVTEKKKTQTEKSKMNAALFGIFLGGLGIHNFYLGNTTRGIIQIIVSILTCFVGSLWGITEGVLILLGYIKEDANGIPLK